MKRVELFKTPALRKMTERGIKPRTLWINEVELLLVLMVLGREIS